MKTKNAGYKHNTNRNEGLIQNTWINLKNIIVSIKIMFQHIVQIY